jgi:hypothetical protein
MMELLIYNAGEGVVKGLEIHFLNINKGLS